MPFLEKKQRNTFKKAKIVKKQTEIERLFKSGKKWNCAWCSIYSLKNGKNRNRCAISISKSSGSAVERNKIKRNVREHFRNYLQNTPLHIDILVKIHPAKDVKKSIHGLEKALTLWLKEEI